MTGPTSAAARERDRVLDEYARRERDVPADRYAPWQPAELLGRIGRKRAAARLLRQVGAFPTTGDRALEVGCGQLGWLADLIEWGVREPDLAGIDLDARRVEAARQRLPAADLRAGDATSLPWPAAAFKLVVASTVFSSVLDAEVRAQIAAEIWRVLAPGGAVVWYDVAVRNPGNSRLAALPPPAIATLFPSGAIRIRRVTLVPALARAVAPRSWVLATLLEGVPFLRTHLVAVIQKS